MPGADYENGIKIDQAKWLSLKRAIAGNAIVSGLVVSKSASMQVSVTAGVAYTQNVRRDIVSSVTFGLDPADGTFDRWDSIYLDSSGARAYKAGTPSIAPKLPDLLDNEILIAAILVPTGTGDVLIEANIRPFGFYTAFLAHKHQEAVAGTDYKINHQDLVSILGVASGSDATLNKHFSDALYKALLDNDAKAADSNSTDTVKDKHLSNNDLREVYKSIPRLNEYVLIADIRIPVIASNSTGRAEAFVAAGISQVVAGYDFIDFSTLTIPASCDQNNVYLKPYQCSRKAATGTSYGVDFRIGGLVQYAWNTLTSTTPKTEFATSFITKSKTYVAETYGFFGLGGAAHYVSQCGMLVYAKRIS